MTFVVKNWQDYVAGNTPLHAIAIKDIETRLSGYTDQQVAVSTGLANTAQTSANTGIANAATAQTTANTAITIANAASAAAAAAQAAATPARGHNLPAGAFGASIYDRASVTSVIITAPPTSGRIHFVRIPVYAGDVITNINFLTGTAAGSGLTNCWAALYNSSLAKLVVSADNTSATWPVDSVRTFALASTYTVLTGTTSIYAGICIVGTTMPSLAGLSFQTAASTNIAPIISFAGTAGLTNPASAPSTTTQAAANRIPYAWLT